MLRAILSNRMDSVKRKWISVVRDLVRDLVQKNEGQK